MACSLEALTGFKLLSWPVNLKWHQYLLANWAMVSLKQDDIIAMESVDIASTLI